jgi:hypothetical protein
VNEQAFDYQCRVARQRMKNRFYKGANKDLKSLLKKQKEIDAASVLSSRNNSNHYDSNRNSPQGTAPAKGRLLGASTGIRNPAAILAGSQELGPQEDPTTGEDCSPDRQDLLASGGLARMTSGSKQHFIQIDMQRNAKHESVNTKSDQER